MSMSSTLRFFNSSSLSSSACPRVSRAHSARAAYILGGAAVLFVDALHLHEQVVAEQGRLIRG